MRNVQNYVFNSCLFEFEDVIEAVDDVSLLSPPQYNWLNRLVKRTVINQSHRIKSSSLMSVNPYIGTIDLHYEHEIYFVILDFPWSISSVNLLKNWRKKCRIAVCYVVEIWNADLPLMANLMPFFDQFDLICIGTFHVLGAIQKMAAPPCIFLAPGIDTLKFYANPQTDARNIDVCSLGRRSPVTHNALIEQAAEESFFYYHELTNGSVLRVEDHQDHRTLVANILKSSRYFITNYAKADLPEHIDGEYEIGYRFFEGAAAGTVLIGSPPKGEMFERYFDWENAVVPVEFDEPNIVEIIAELDAQPELVKQIQTNNVVNSLLKHDWVYRWEQILSELGMPATLEMNSRKMQLKEMADSLLVSLNSASEASAESSENQSSSVPLPEAELVNAEAVSV
ncbi:MAG: glycosyltransferase [Cyanobacteria bacterium P01_C01_bin.69]